MTINERINELVKQLSNGNKRAFSITIGVNPTVIENILGKRSGNPSFEVLQKIVFAFENINSEWLLIGKGEIFKNKISNYSNLKTVSEPIAKYGICSSCEDKERIIKEKEERIKELKDTISILKDSCTSKRNSA